MLCLVVLCCTAVSCKLLLCRFFLHLLCWCISFSLLCYICGIITVLSGFYANEHVRSKQTCILFWNSKGKPQIWLISVLTVLHLLFLSFYSWKHPQKLARFDLLWEHHLFFICSNLNSMLCLYRFRTCRFQCACCVLGLKVLKSQCFIYLLLFVMKSGLSSWCIYGSL